LSSPYDINEFLKRLVRARTVGNILVDRKRLISSVSRFAGRR